ncbi:LCP family protein [bacterium]|jgi:LCP family protein required for cell wall assembly|nr:LCP family protein [bacterium]
MKILNKYTYLFIGVLLTSAIVVLTIIPRFETQEFNPQRVEDISQGLTTTTSSASETLDSITENQTTSTLPEINESEQSEIEKLLVNNVATAKIANYKSYLLIGSDERSQDSSSSRGFVDGQRSDVIIVGLIDEISNNHYLLSIPRDILVINSCTNNLERINASFTNNECGNSAENLAAAVKGITGITIEHFASFNFEGFENIIDSFDGIEICVDETQREGYSFELQKGCQVVNGSTALNWVVSRNTEVLVGEKVLDDNGDDASEWVKMSGVSDLSRNERQQYVVLQLLERVDDFDSLSELNKFINTLEDSFIIDENLTLNNAINTLWNFRGTNFNNIKKLSIPTSPYELQDGRQVLIISKNFSQYASENSLINP